MPDRKRGNNRLQQLFIALADGQKHTAEHTKSVPVAKIARFLAIETGEDDIDSFLHRLGFLQPAIASSAPPAANPAYDNFCAEVIQPARRVS